MGERLRIDPADLGIHAVGPGRVLERLGHRQVRVGKLDVLADEGDLQAGLGRLDPLDQRPPRREVGLGFRVAKGELAHDEPAQAGLLELERDLVDRGRGFGRNHGIGGDVREQGDLVPDLVRNGVIRAQDDDVRLDADAAKLLHGVLRGLGLELAGGGKGGQERHVDI